MPGPIERMRAWLQRKPHGPRVQQAETPADPASADRLMLAPPALPPLNHASAQLQARYRAFVSRPHPDPVVGRQLVRDLRAAAIDLSSTKAHEPSPDIYWLIQGAATVALLACGSGSDEFKACQRDLHAYRDAPLTRIQVQWFDRHVATVDTSSYLHVQPADIDELLAFQPRLYPDGTPIQAVVACHDDRWPVYAEAVQAFFSAAGKDCWSDFDYDVNRAGEMLKTPERIASASLDELRSMLTWCVRGERFCDGHHALVIENGYVLALLQRLQALRQHETADSPPFRNERPVP
ncbi:DUF6508 domain-containing protein [Phytopseudomonas dryadis]|nr:MULTISPECIES: DUF6508 domain-containing protein [Pseudomonas]